MWHVIFTGLGSAAIALSLNRLALGLFFGISGYHKLFHPQRRETIKRTMIALHIPRPLVMAVVVPTFEFLCGLSLIVGLLSPLSCVALVSICGVACYTDGIKNKIPSYHPLNRFDWLDDLLYLPETWYIVALLVVMLVGPGTFSLDWLIVNVWRLV